MPPCPNSPLHELIRAFEACGDAFVVREIIRYWSFGVPALHMELWAEHFLGKQIGVHATHAVTGHLGEQIGSAAFAPGARAGLESEGIGLASLY